MLLDWYYVTIQSLQSLWQAFLMFVPRLIGAIIVFIIGWFVAIGIGKLVSKILEKIKFNKVFEKGGWKSALEKAELKLDVAEFIGMIVKWILVIVFLMAAVEILGLYQFSGFLRGVLSYLPNVLVASLIFVVAVILADILAKIVVAATEKVKFQHTRFAGEIIRWAIWIFAIFAILIQLGIARELLSVLFTGIVALLAIAGGIAFGLGGKDSAAELLENLMKKIKS